MQKTAIILWTSRSDWDTWGIVKNIQSKLSSTVFDLNKYEISYYDYKQENLDDDFIALFIEIVTNYDHIMFATPVYWYSMSAIMKTFFDRLSDFLWTDQDLKKLWKKLQWKKMYVVTTSNWNNIEEQFFIPFEETAKYMWMTYIDWIHIINSETLEEKENKISTLINKIK